MRGIGSIDSAPLLSGQESRIFAIWLYFDVDYDAQLKDGRDVAYVYIWPSGLNGFVRYSNKCEFAFFTWKGFTKEHEAFLRSSGCLHPVKPPHVRPRSIQWRQKCRGDEGPPTW